MNTQKDKLSQQMFSKDFKDLTEQQKLRIKRESGTLKTQTSLELNPMDVIGTPEYNARRDITLIKYGMTDSTRGIFKGKQQPH